MALVGLVSSSGSSGPTNGGSNEYYSESDLVHELRGADVPCVSPQPQGANHTARSSKVVVAGKMRIGIKLGPQLLPVCDQIGTV